MWVERGIKTKQMADVGNETERRKGREREREGERGRERERGRYWRNRSEDAERKPAC